jgi:hypothetical protein
MLTADDLLTTIEIAEVRNQCSATSVSYTSLEYIAEYYISDLPYTDIWNS